MKICGKVSKYYCESKQYILFSVALYGSIINLIAWFTWVIKVFIIITY